MGVFNEVLVVLFLFCFIIIGVLSVLNVLYFIVCGFDKWWFKLVKIFEIVRNWLVLCVVVLLVLKVVFILFRLFLFVFDVFL